MTWIVLFPLLLVFAALARTFGKKWAAKATHPDTESLNRGDYKAAGIGAKIVSWATLGGAALLTVLSCLYTVDAGYVGVVKTFGHISGQTTDGLVVVGPWQQVTKVSTRTGAVHFKDIESFSSETQDVFIDATLNLSVSPLDVQKLYRTVGSDWFEKLVPPRVNQTIKDVTVKFPSVLIAPNREEIRKAVRDRLEAQLARYSIHVTDFLLDNISFPKAFTDAILRKQVATQDAQTAQNKIKVSEAEAKQKAARAEGDAAATLINATAQAKANRLLAQSLSTELIQFTAIQKLNPNIKTVIVPSGSGLLLPSSVVGDSGGGK